MMSEELTSGMLDDSPSVTAALEQGAGEIAPDPAPLPLPSGLIKSGLVCTRRDGKKFIKGKDMFKLRPADVAWVAEHGQYRVKPLVWFLP